MNSDMTMAILDHFWVHLPSLWRLHE